MKAPAIVAATLIWTAVSAGVGFAAGYYVRGTAAVTKETQEQTRATQQKARKDRKALAVGIRTEQAQIATDTAFQKIRSDYEADQRSNPHAGCVLDADSLRRWNEANAQSDRDATVEPDGSLSAAPATGTGRERGE